MTLPDKPEQVKDVSDRLWEAALDKVTRFYGYNCWSEACFWITDRLEALLIDHARLLILQGEVTEPRDPLDEAIEALINEWMVARDASPILDYMKRNIRTHLGPFLKGEG